MTQRQQGGALPPVALALACLLLVGGCALRLLHLDADPHYYGWWGHLYDEGRWVQQARELALGRELETSVTLAPNLGVAPGFEVASWVAFEIGGVSRCTARIVSALSGCALLGVLALFLWRRASTTGLFLGLALIAPQADLVVLSRVALPEVPAMLGSLAAFAVLAAGPPRRIRLALGGALAALTVALKITTLPLVGIFAVVVVAMREGGAQWRERGRDLAAYAIGLGAVAIPGIALALAAFAELPETLASRLHFFRQFVELNEPYAIAALPLDGRMAPVLSPASLALWGAALAALAAKPAPPGLRPWWRGAALWALLYSAFISLQRYLPERYLAHLLPPLALVAAAATTKLEQVGVDGVAAGLATGRGAGRAVRWAILALPSAVLVAPLGAMALAVFGLPANRVSLRWICILAAWSAATLAAAASAHRPERLRLWLAFPVAGTALWFTAWAVSDTPLVFWPETASAPALAGRLAWLFAAAIVALGASALRPWRGWPVVAAGTLWCLAWGVQLAPGFLAPHTTVRDASRVLGARLEGAASLEQYRAEGLFLDNALPFRALNLAAYRKDPPEWVVTELPLDSEADFLRAHYELVGSFDLYVPPTHWLRPRPSPVCSEQQGQCVGLYQLRSR